MAGLSIHGVFWVSNMSVSELETALRDAALGGLRFLPVLGSTNDEALAWAARGARDYSLVVADTQTSGRGRDGRKWFTPTGSGLAFSLVLRPSAAEREVVSRFSGLGALALVNALERHKIQAQVKWPNDVLVKRKKIAGILVEVVWMGTEVDSLVLGMGVNVLAGSVPPADQLNFPATCVELETDERVARYDLLNELLKGLQVLRKSLVRDVFVQTWEDVLAFRGETVSLWQDRHEPFQAVVLGLDLDGALRVRLENGDLRSINFGEVHLRPGNTA